MDCETCNECATHTLSLTTGRSNWAFYCWKCLVLVLMAWYENPEDLEGFEVRHMQGGLMDAAPRLTVVSA